MKTDFPVSFARIFSLTVNLKELCSMFLLTVTFQAFFRWIISSSSQKHFVWRHFLYLITALSPFSSWKDMFLWLVLLWIFPCRSNRPDSLSRSSFVYAVGALLNFQDITIVDAVLLCWGAYILRTWNDTVVMRNMCQRFALIIVFFSTRVTLECYDQVMKLSCSRLTTISRGVNFHFQGR